MFTFTLERGTTLDEETIRTRITDNLADFVRRKIPRQQVVFRKTDEGFLLSGESGTAELHCDSGILKVIFTMPILYRPLRYRILRAADDILERLL